MDRNGLTYELSKWISKYCRDSWRYDCEKNCIYVTGNMTITDPKIKKLPIDIYCEGVLFFKNCSSLLSIEGIIDIVMKELKFENCALPSEIYYSAYIRKISIEEYLEDEIDEIIQIPENLEAIKKHFPLITEKHRGRIIGAKFGF